MSFENMTRIPGFCGKERDYCVSLPAQAQYLKGLPPLDAKALIAMRAVGMDRMHECARWLATMDKHPDHLLQLARKRYAS